MPLIRWDSLPQVSVLCPCWEHLLCSSGPPPCPPLALYGALPGLRPWPWCVHSVRGARALQGCGGGSWVDCSLSEVPMPPWPPCPEGAWVYADQAGSLLNPATALELHTGFRGATWRADPKGQCG